MRKLKIIIVGGGSAGFMTASAILKAYGDNIDLSLIESSKINTIGVGEATIPQILLFNRFLGIEENEFIKKTKATIKLGIRFENWHSSHKIYEHAFGIFGKSIGNLDFQQYWIKYNNLYPDKIGDLWKYSINARMIKEGKFFPLTSNMIAPLNGFSYAYHFDAFLYAEYLRQYCLKYNFKIYDNIVKKVELDGENGFVKSLHLDSDEILGADLFIDCTGLRALLIGDALKVKFEDWSNYLPCNNAIALQSKNGAELPPFTRSIAHKAGWQWRIPLQHRRGNGIVFDSNYLSEDEALNILTSSIDEEILTEPNKIKFTTGKREKIWHKNVLAVGLSSGFLEPLESTSIHLIQSAINRLLTHLTDKIGSKEIENKFNKSFDKEYVNIRDFLIAHYYLNDRDEEFWKDYRSKNIPKSLEEKINLFQETGKIYWENDELFTEVGWLQILIGGGIKIKNQMLLANQLNDAQANKMFENIDKIIANIVKPLPKHETYINNICE